MVWPLILRYDNSVYVLRPWIGLDGVYALFWNVWTRSWVAQVNFGVLADVFWK